ncbi:MAG TPA: hypothetical protein PLH57_08690, partial [Oligoflexia bacterium]|nr:hypothetical protein [Oligoflexia bacterium]
MSVNKLVLVSSGPEDLDFALKVCQRFRIQLAVPKSWHELLETLSESYSTYIFWALGDLELHDASHPFFIGAIEEALTGQVDPSRVFALTTKPIHHYQDMFEKFPTIKGRFQHNLIRNYPPGCEILYARLLEYCSAPEPSGLQKLFDPTTKIQRLALKNSSQKNSAVSALEKTLLKTGFDERIASRIAQATDELLMNAIFDASRDSSGVANRQMLDRRVHFAFGPQEPVEMEFGLNQEYFAICVTDHFGSLKKETLFKFLHQNYQDKDYQLRKYGPGAGLGLYGIVA